MNDLFTLDSDTNGSEPLDEGGTWLLDLVSAVDHLRRGYRPGLTVWHALAEAMDASSDAGVDGTDIIRQRDGDLAMQRAVRRWVVTMAERYNAGFHWPHPTPRRTFPPARITLPDEG